ncbi:endonuclease [Winogradskyella luteola]|uniref:Endonuclease n=1 Tax=Winogradskyella luteola TaxID=2828330 RepID=A0A9X1JMM2_9FLAO|nr:endonuclease [Winogradskyella luteola]MBV7268615.1 endonuclease [Winogradskyella luteola]
MKHIYILLLAILTSALGFAQIPAGYYDHATGTGYTLKTQLKRIINDIDDPEINNTIEEEHNQQTYNSLDPFNATYERDFYYEVNGDNTILDMYSENPNGNDPYNYSPVSDECGNFNSEGDCYNKEHVIPQSVFNSQLPMYSDAHHLIPTDGRVNGFRSNFPFGRVDDNQLVNQSGISNPTQNGSKLGNNLNSGYSAGYSATVFEPIDEFKGDIARIYFYFVTRYEDQISSWDAYPMFDGSSDKAIADPFLSILITWHQNDPVSQKEIDRNNNIYYNHQNNRNPFVDNPQYVDLIWNTTPDTEAPSDPINLVASNPTDTTVDLDWTASTDNVGVTSYDIYIDGSFVFNTGSVSNNTIATGLSADTLYCFTIKARDAAGNESNFSNQSCEVTTDNGNTNLNCINETFENIPAASSQYSDFSWVGSDGFTFNATDARTDQTLDGRAITIRNGTLQYTDNFSDLIETVTVTTQRVFSGDSGTFDLVVNGNIVGTIPYNDTPTTTTINVDINPFNTLNINNNSNPSNRVRFDNLSWTCGILSATEFKDQNINIFPNPIKSLLNINLKSDVETNVEIYDVLGKRVYTKMINTSKALNLQALKNGIYILKISQENSSITKRLVKN